MFTRILVPLDGSDVAAQALPYAIALAEKFGSGLTLTGVLLPHLQDLGIGDIFRMASETRRAAEDRAILVASEYLDNVAAPLRARGLSAGIDLICGDDAADEIVGAAAADGTLIAMSTHGRTGLKRLRLGSVAQKVIRRATVPTLIVRAQANPPTGNVVPLEQITVTLDGSPLAETALPIATRLAGAFGAPLTLLRAIPNVTYPTAYYDTAYIPPIEELEQYARAEAERYLAEVAARLTPLDVRTQAVYGPVGTAVEIISDYLAKQPPGIVVMASHGRGGVSRLVLGSAAEGVVTGAPCPVLIVRSETAPVPRADTARASVSAL